MTVERIVCRILWWGGVLGITLMLVGLVGFAARSDVDGPPWSPAQVRQPPRAAVSRDVFTSFAQILEGLRHRPVDPLAIGATGILILLVTPVGAVATAVPAFLVANDRRYAAIASILVLALLASLLIGGA